MRMILSREGEKETYPLFHQQTFRDTAGSILNLTANWEAVGGNSTSHILLHLLQWWDLWEKSLTDPFCSGLMGQN